MRLAGCSGDPAGAWDIFPALARLCPGGDPAFPLVPEASPSWAPTSVDDLAEEVGPRSSGAVPAAVPELPLALAHGTLQPTAYAVQNPWVLTDQPPLLSAQQLQTGLQHQLQTLGVRQQVCGGGYVHDAPIGTQNESSGSARGPAP